MHLPWKVPAPLQPGDAVHVIAPSGGLYTEHLQPGIELLREHGLRPVVSDALWARHLYFAGNDAHRGAALTQALEQTDGSALWAARGGYGAARLLGRLATISPMAPARWLVGFSDASVMHCAWGQARCVSLHAANVKNLPTWSVAHRTELFDWLFGRCAHQRFAGRRLLGTQRVQGRLLGGNLTVLASLVGCQALPAWNDAIVFFEDINERPYRLDRSITQLRLAGAFHGAVGVVVGQLTGCAGVDAADPTALQAIADALMPLDIPVLVDLPLGHDDSSRAVPFGAWATLDAAQGVLHVEVTR